MDGRCYDLLASRTPDGVAVRLAIRSGAPWHEVYDIVKAKVNGLGVEDEESGLMPFMMVTAASAVENDDYGDESSSSEEEDGTRRDIVMSSLTLVYEMLCMKPDVMNMYDTDSSIGSYQNPDGSGLMMKRRQLV